MASTFDINHLTEDRISELLHLFRLYDKEGDQALRTQDLGQVLRACGQNCTESEVNSLMRQVDPQNTGTISFPAFLDMMAARTSMASDVDDIIEAFRSFDKNNTGYVDAKELKQVLVSLGEKLSDQEAEEMIRDAGGDRGQINYRQFAKVLAGKS